MAIKPNTFIHAMGNAHVMFQFVSDTDDVAQNHATRFVQKLIDNGVIHSREADTDIEIGVDVVEGMVLSRVWIWVDLDKLTALHTFAALIPRKVT